MSFLAVVLALLLEPGLRHLESLRSPNWFHAYLEACLPLTRVQKPGRAALGAVLVALLPAVIVMFLGDLLSQVGGTGSVPGQVLGYAFAVVVLLFCLGPRDLHAETQAYLDAQQAGDEVVAERLARALIGGAVPARPVERAQAVTRAVFAEANARLFGVLFWFALLGPSGALFYRCADLLRRTPLDTWSPEFRSAVARLHGILAWVPAHLTALGYAFAGSFEDAVSDLKAYYNACTLSFFDVSNDVLVCTGLGAIRGTAAEDAGIMRVKSALGLVRRTLFIWLAIYALITLFGWSW
jgi:membrane protein required for beta-lactamase induction